MEQYIELLKTMIRDFEPMIATENNKIKAIQEGNLGQVDIYMREEQAHTLKLRGFEKKRAALQEELGLGDMTLQQITQAAPAAYRQELSSLSLKLQDSLKRFKAVNESANEILKTDLRYIDRILEQAQQSADSESSRSDLYTQTRGKTPESGETTHFTQRKV